MPVPSHNLLGAAPARGLLGMLLILAASAVPALANHCDDDDGDDEGGRPVTAPELDPGSMVGSLTLLVGGTLLLADRRGRSKPPVGPD